VKQTGAAAKGYPVWSKTTMFDENGQPSFLTVREVVEFVQGPLDASLFDVPPTTAKSKTFPIFVEAKQGFSQQFGRRRRAELETGPPWSLL
jgi:hypothetical protein